MLPSVQLSERSVCDLELLATGAFTPLDRFMGRDAWHRVRDEMRLSDGTLFPMPITLPVPRETPLSLDRPIALRDAENHLLATMDVTEIFEATVQDPDRLNISGRLEVFELPRRYDFRELRMTPAQTRKKLQAIGASNIIAFQTLDPLSAVHRAAIASASRAADAAVFIDPIVGVVQPGDFEHFARVRTYRTVVEASLDPTRAVFSIVPLPARLRDTRELLWHALVRRNYGANCAIVAPDQLLPETLTDEIGLTQIPFCDDDQDLTAGRVPLRDHQGFCIWFTGLSGAGKSTTAGIVTAFLQERGRRVTVLDGDVVRTHLSKGLGFSRNDRDTNIRRIGFVAAEIVKHGGAVICAAVSPYRETRDEVRSLVGRDRFIEVFVDTPLAECERRDVKGMYARARQGKVQGFTGIDDPYEAPLEPELTLKTIGCSPDENATHVLDYLVQARWIGRS